MRKLLWTFAVFMTVLFIWANLAQAQDHQNGGKEKPPVVEQIPGPPGPQGPPGPMGPPGPAGVAVIVEPTDWPYPYPQPFYDIATPILVGAKAYDIVSDGGINDQLYITASRDQILVVNAPRLGIDWPGRACYQVRKAQPDGHDPHPVVWDAVSAVTTRRDRELFIRYFDTETGTICKLRWMFEKNGECLPMPDTPVINNLNP